MILTLFFPFVYTAFFLFQQTVKLRVLLGLQHILIRIVNSWPPARLTEPLTAHSGSSK